VSCEYRAELFFYKFSVVAFRRNPLGRAWQAVEASDRQRAYLRAKNKLTPLRLQ